MRDAAPATWSIAVDPPETVRCGPTKYRAGPTVYRALAHMIAAGGSTTTTALAVAVWGPDRGPRMTPGTSAFRGMVHRANLVLYGIRAREQLSQSEDTVVFLV